MQQAADREREKKKRKITVWENKYIFFKKYMKAILYVFAFFLYNKLHFPPYFLMHFFSSSPSRKFSHIFFFISSLSFLSFSFFHYYSFFSHSCFWANRKIGKPRARPIRAPLCGRAAGLNVYLSPTTISVAPWKLPKFQQMTAVLIRQERTALRSSWLGGETIRCVTHELTFKTKKKKEKKWKTHITYVHVLIYNRNNHRAYTSVLSIHHGR